MTLTNYTSDGQYPVLAALFRVIAVHGPMEKNELIRVCTVKEAKHLRETLTTWTSLSLFVERKGEISIAPGFAKKRGEALEDLTARLPGMCRTLLFDQANALPMWRADGDRTDVGIGPSADFVRELAWTLAQDIYTLSYETGAESASARQDPQIAAGKHIFVNYTRWPGLCFWARYTGFASGDESLIDPTYAIRSELPAIFQGSRVMGAREFLRNLSERLPVLDFGKYRADVESTLDQSAWRKPPENHLSMSLSFALRRLDMDGVLHLSSPADAGDTFTLSGRNFRPWLPFSKVELGRSES